MSWNITHEITVPYTDDVIIASALVVTHQINPVIGGDSLTAEQEAALLFTTPRIGATFVLANGLLFDRIRTDYNDYTIIGNDVIGIDSTGIVNGSEARISINGNGVNTPDLTAFTQYDTGTGALTFDTTKANRFIFFRDDAIVYWVIIAQVVIDDIIPPVYSNVSTDQITQTAFRFNAQLNEIGTIYWGLYANGATAPTKTQIVAGIGALQYGTISCSAGVLAHQTISTLSVNTSYDLYHYAVDASDNETDIQTRIDVTTLAASQLSAPVISAVANGQNQIDISWSNITSNEGYEIYGSDSELSGFSLLDTNLTDDITYFETGLSASQTRYYYVITLGNGSTTLDSNPSNTDSATTNAVAAPTVVSASTSVNGLTLSIKYSKTMPASPTYTGLSTSPVRTITAATRNGSDNTQVDYTISVAFANGDTITCAYTPGNIVSDDGGVLASFSGQAVTNNVPAADVQLVSPAPSNIINMSISGNDVLSSGTSTNTICQFRYSMAGAGRVEVDYTGTNNDQIYFGYSATSGGSTRNSFAGVYFDANNIWYWSGAGLVGSVPRSNYGTITKLAWTRNGSNVITIEVYDGTWHTLSTLTPGTVSGTLYLYCCCGSAYRISNPIGEGVTQI